ncbi:CoA pyrophosphatase [bacterium]|nr:CoA pyrophosphatase [bacterium]
MFTFNGERIAQALETYHLRQSDRVADILSQKESPKLRPSAILMPLLEYEGRWHLLLTQRSDTLVEHRGQVSFPGGSKDQADPDLCYTALRETKEEIGVAPKDVKVFGKLGQMPIITGYMVHMFVGQIPWPYDLHLNPAEVESAFIVPLHWLVDPDHRTIRYHSFAGREFPVIYFDLFEGHQLWGASAEMTLALLEALGLRD